MLYPSIYNKIPAFVTKKSVKQLKVAILLDDSIFSYIVNIVYARWILLPQVLGPVHFQQQECPVSVYCYHYLWNFCISCKQCRSWLDTTFCSVWSGSSLFASVSFMGWVSLWLELGWAIIMLKVLIKRNMKKVFITLKRILYFGW